MMVLVYVTTAPESFTFFRGQIKYMKERGFEVHAVSSNGEMLKETGVREDIPVHAIEMPRRLSPIIDLLAVNKLYSLFNSLKPAIVHANFPKGGLLGVLAAQLARIPVVIYGMRGLRFDTSVGINRKLLYLTEALSCRVADLVITNSFSIWKRVVTEGLCPGEKIKIMASGSSNGVDAQERFNPKRLHPGLREETKVHHQIPKDSLVVGYVGRVVRDKGIIELEMAWQVLRDRFPKVFLLLVGPIETHDPVPQHILERLLKDPQVIYTGQVSDPVPYYAAMDILVLPTYREGFPNTPLEAAAMQLPVVATRVDGCVEAVEDGVTGLLVPPRDSQALAQAIQELLLNPGMRREMGKAGRQRVLRHFQPEAIWQALYETYLELLGTRKSEGIKSPPAKSS